MTNVEECIHLLNPAWCADCNGRAAQQRKDHDQEVARVLAIEGWFKAHYGGRCAGCGEYFHVGTPIRHSGQFEHKSGGAWVAMCCAPAGDPA